MGGILFHGRAAVLTLLDPRRRHRFSAARRQHSNGRIVCLRSSFMPSEAVRRIRSAGFARTSPKPWWRTTACRPKPSSSRSSKRRRPTSPRAVCCSV